MKFKITDAVPNGAPYRAGQVVEIQPRNAGVWKRRGWAVEVGEEPAPEEQAEVPEEQPEVEAAVAADPPETAAKRTKRTRRKRSS